MGWGQKLVRFPKGKEAGRVRTSDADTRPLELSESEIFSVSARILSSARETQSCEFVT